MSFDEPESPPHPAESVDDSFSLTVVTLAEFAARRRGRRRRAARRRRRRPDPRQRRRDGLRRRRRRQDHARASTSPATSPPATTGSASPSPGPVSVLLVENEGPRPLFRVKAERKLDGWTGLAARRPGPHRRGAVGARSRSPPRRHRAELARQIADHEIDVVIIGPLAAAGMNEAGTLARGPRRSSPCCDDVRQLAGRTGHVRARSTTRTRAARCPARGKAPATR